MPTWTREQFENYQSKQNRNLDAADKVARLYAEHPKPVARPALVEAVAGEEAHWYSSGRRFEVQYHVYSVRPIDYDGYDIKPLQDLLVRAKIIPDDKWNVLLGRTIPHKVQTAAEEKTEIVIEAYE